MQFRLHPIIPIIAAMLLVSGRVTAQEEKLATRPPNVLLLLADDMTYRDLGCYGNPDVETPHLDKLAATGMRFRNCFNSTAMCAPTRMSLYTGIHPVRNGAWPNHSQVYDEIRSLPQHLESAGYTTALLGKRHEAPLQNFPFQHLGGRHHDDGDGIALPIDKAREFIESQQDKPWCLVVANNQPHTPWNRGDASAYLAEDIEVPPFMIDTPEIREALTKYYAEVTYMDSQVGECLKILDESGQAPSTLVIFLSEQGSQIPLSKWTCYETGLRSAAIASWPGVIAEGTTCDAMIQYVDFVPTLLDVIWSSAGTEFDPQDRFDGKSFKHLLADPKASHHQFVFGLHTTVGVAGSRQPYGIRTVRNSQHRLIWNLHSGNKFDIGGWRNFAPLKSWRTMADTQNDPFVIATTERMSVRPEFELYDANSDPYCMQNIADTPQMADVQSQLWLRLKNWMKQQGDLGAETEIAGRQRLNKEKKK